MRTLADGRVEVFTFKQGLLSKVAHDLRLSCEKFRVDSDGSTLVAEFSVDSLRVDGAMRRGALDASSLSESDRREILENVRTKILHADQFPVVRYEATIERRPGGGHVSGTLSLCGKSVALAFDVAESAGRWRGDVELTPSRWGIAPFKAMLGAIKLEDRVVVHCDFPVIEF